MLREGVVIHVSDEVMHGWNPDIYEKYMSMNIWDPRYAICRYRLYAYFDALVEEGTLTRIVADSMIRSVEDKFYTENVKSRTVAEKMQQVMSSFHGNSRRCMLEKISLDEFRWLRDKLEVFCYFYEERIPSTEVERNNLFVSYINKAINFLLEEWSAQSPKYWEYYILLLNDIRIFFLSRPYLTSNPIQSVTETLTLFCDLYYQTLDEEFQYFKDLGIGPEDKMRGGKRLVVLDLMHTITKEFLIHPTEYGNMKAALLASYKEEDVLEAFSDVENISNETLPMMMERCINRIEDYPSFIEGLTRYGDNDIKKIYREAYDISDLTDDKLGEYVLNYYYVLILAAISQNNTLNYIDSCTNCLSLLKILYEDGAVSLDELKNACNIIDMEADEMFLAIKSKITEDILGPLISKIEETGEEIKLAEEVKNVDGHAFYTENDNNETEIKENNVISMQRMNLGGD